MLFNTIFPGWIFFSNPNLRSQKFKPNLKMPKDTHVKKSFSCLLWKLRLKLHNKKIPKDTHVKKPFLFLLWKLWLTLHNKKIPKETHVEKSFSFLLWKLWLTRVAVFCWIIMFQMSTGVEHRQLPCLKILMWRSHFHFSCENWGLNFTPRKYLKRLMWRSNFRFSCEYCG